MFLTMAYSGVRAGLAGVWVYDMVGQGRCGPAKARKQANQDCNNEDRLVKTPDRPPSRHTIVVKGGRLGGGRVGLGVGSRGVFW